MEAGGYKLERFEGAIPDISTGHLLDLKFVKSVGDVKKYKLIEMKNWKSAQSISGTNFNQFKAYISSGHKFEYHFSDGIQGNMKTSFQNAFKDLEKAQELWSANPNYFKGLSGEIANVQDIVNLANTGQLIDLMNFVR